MKKQHIILPRNRAESFTTVSAPRKANNLFWRWGDDNLFPTALALMARRATIHRRIINDKADYIAGRGFIFDQHLTSLAEITAKANGAGETLSEVMRKVAFDKILFGNAFAEIITSVDSSFLSVFHQDASRCRVARDSKRIIMHHDWSNFTPKDAVSLPIFPLFEKTKDGTLRSIIHYKDYEPMFENYGVPSYIAGMGVSAIAYKTDTWNISRLDNSFQLSGVMMLDAAVDSATEAADIVRAAEGRFAGRPGQVMFMIKESAEQENSKFIPITTTSEGDWKDLHSQASSDIVIAHSWFRTLSGMDYGSGFSAERVLHEYNIALNTVISAAQRQILEPIKGIIERVLDVDCSSLTVVNQPPTSVKPPYMKIWEARKADGLEYDASDETQQNYLSNLK